MSVPVVRFGLLGCGTVGQGLVKALRASQGMISQRYGFRFELAGVAVRDPMKSRAVSLPKRLLRTPAEIINDPYIPIIVELIGGVKDAGRFVFNALLSGKHVVTANKALLAERATQLFQEAMEHHCRIRFEASVAGGIPVIALFQRHFAADTVFGISGILNGTTNYVLTEMAEHGVDFVKAVKQAQALGYAERDPSADISGSDAACKLAILCSLGFGVRVDVQSIVCRGIETITLHDMVEARRLGYVIKMLAIGRQVDAKLELRVEPVMIPKDSELAGVRGVFNAVSVKTRFSDRQTYLGLGAGQMPTANAVLADLVEVAQHVLRGRSELETPPWCWRNWNNGKYRVLKPDSIRSPFYLRLGLEDRRGALTEVAKILSKAGVSLADVRQDDATKLPKGKPVPVVVTTHRTSRQRFLEAFAAIRQLQRLPTAPMWLPIEDQL